MDNKKIYNSIRTGAKISWKEIYNNENELLKDLKKINPIEYEQKFYKGSMYVKSFINQLKLGRELSDKQMTQLKRLSKYIKLYSIEQNKI